MLKPLVRLSCVRAAVLAAFLPLLLAGCSNMSFSPQGASGSANMTGNWNVSAASPTAATSYFLLGGLLTNNGGTMTGLLRVLNAQNSPCVAPGTVITFNGTTQQNGSLTLTSTPFSGTTLTIAGTATTNSTPAVIQNATYSFTGSCQGNGNVLASALPVIDGTFSGATQPWSDASAVTASFHESSTVNAAGEFPLSGSLSFKGLSCLTSVTMDPSASYISGAAINAQFTGTDNQGQTASVQLSGNYTNVAMSIQYTVTSGSCSGSQGAAVLNLNSPS